MFKKLLTMACAAALIASPNAVEASTGWDYVGSSVFQHTSVVVSSTGGDFQACLADGQVWKGYVSLWENDPDNPDDEVTDGSRYLAPGTCATWRGIGGYVDGDNAKAEFYLKKSGDVQITVKFYD